MGTSGVILHWDGIAWGWGQGGASQYELLGVWGTKWNNVWVVGAEGVIARWDGASWSNQYGKATTWFFGVWGAGANPPNPYVVGADGAILHR